MQLILKGFRDIIKDKWRVRTAVEVFLLVGRVTYFFMNINGRFLINY